MPIRPTANFGPSVYLQSCGPGLESSPNGFEEVMLHGRQRAETTVTASYAHKRRAPTERIALQYVDSDVHPVPHRGVLLEYIPEPWRSKYFTTHTVGDRSTTTRQTVRTPTRCASTLPRRRRIRRQRPRPGVQTAHYGSRRRRRNPIRDHRQRWQGNPSLRRRTRFPILSPITEERHGH